MRGRFSDSTIYIPLEIYGVTPESKKTFLGIVDTGFAGYLTLPLSDAFPLGLVLKGEQSHALADGSISRHFVCLGTVSFEGASALVPIDVQQGGPILIGMQLLKKFGKDLAINFTTESFEFLPAKSSRRTPVPGVKLNF